MRNHLATLTAALAIMFSLAAGSRLQAVDIYVLSMNVSGTGNTQTRFGKIDSVSGAYSEINSAVSGVAAVRNLAWNPAISAFNVVESSGLSTNLRTLTTAGTLSSQVGSFISKNIYGMTYRPSDQTLYAFDNDTNDTGTISPSAGGWSVLNANPGIAAKSSVGGRYTLLNDTIYVAADNNFNGQFGTIGFTASSTFSQTGTNNSLFEYMVLATDGTSLYGIYGDGTAGNQALYSINTATGVPSFITTVSGTGLGTYFSGAGILPVPEPSTYALAAIASGVLAFVARRRKQAKSA